MGSSSPVAVTARTMTLCYSEILLLCGHVVLVAGGDTLEHNPGKPVGAIDASQDAYPPSKRKF